jgi:hypothetical protein
MTTTSPGPLQFAHLDVHQDGLPEVPWWAKGVRRSKNAVAGLPQAAGGRPHGSDDEDRALEPVDKGGVLLLSGPGIFVAVIQDKRPDPAMMSHAAAVLYQADPDPLHVRAIALSPELVVDPLTVAHAAAGGFTFARDDGESALARGRNFMIRMIRLRREAIDYLARSDAGQTTVTTVRLPG